MTSKVQELHKKGLINPPSFLTTNVHYETMMGSVAYGVSSNESDVDPGIGRNPTTHKLITPDWCPLKTEPLLISFQGII